MGHDVCQFDSFIVAFFCFCGHIRDSSGTGGDVSVSVDTYETVLEQGVTFLFL
jgi:hypothetical protein